MWKKVKINLAEKPSSCGGCKYNLQNVCKLTEHSTLQVGGKVSMYCPIKENKGEIYMHMYVQEDKGICCRCRLEKDRVCTITGKRTEIQECPMQIEEDIHLTYLGLVLSCKHDFDMYLQKGDHIGFYAAESTLLEDITLAPTVVTIKVENREEFNKQLKEYGIEDIFYLEIEDLLRFKYGDEKIFNYE